MITEPSIDDFLILSDLSNKRPQWKIADSYPQISNDCHISAPFTDGFIMSIMERGHGDFTVPKVLEIAVSLVSQTPSSRKLGDCVVCKNYISPVRCVGKEKVCEQCMERAGKIKLHHGKTMIVIPYGNELYVYYLEKAQWSNYIFSRYRYNPESINLIRCEGGIIPLTCPRGHKKGKCNCVESIREVFLRENAQRYLLARQILAQYDLVDVFPGVVRGLLSR
jgi:hypothetical protein